MTSMTSHFEPEIKIIKEFCCLRCRSHVKVAELVIPFGPQAGQTVKQANGCDCEVLDIVEHNQRKAKVKNLQSIFNQNSLINNDLIDATFDNYDSIYFRNEFKKAQGYAEEFNLNEPKNLLFQGTFGTGKSHLSVAITKEIMKKGYSAIFISIPQLLTKIRNSYNKNSEHSEEEILNMIMTADLVVFDDIGAESGASGWAMQKLFEVIDGRLGKHNIFTTNLSSNDFENSIELKRIFSRMVSKVEFIVMNGKDYRFNHLGKGV